MASTAATAKEGGRKIVNLWCIPRSCSTALMYSFAQRDDTTVVDEPLYAHFLSNYPKVESVCLLMSVSVSVLSMFECLSALFARRCLFFLDLDLSLFSFFCSSIVRIGSECCENRIQTETRSSEMLSLGRRSFFFYYFF
jgi:Sulfotransferase domain